MPSGSDLETAAGCVPLRVLSVDLVPSLRGQATGDATRSPCVGACRRGGPGRRRVRAVGTQTRRAIEARTWREALRNEIRKYYSAGLRSAPTPSNHEAP